MDWNPKTWKFNWKNGKERWILLLAAGLLLLILAMPLGSRSSGGRSGTQEFVASEKSGSDTENAGSGAGTADGTWQAEDVLAYEEMLEKRLTEVLSHVEGVGEVQVMIVTDCSGEKVWRVDRDTVQSATEESDSGGGSRKVESRQIQEETVLSGGSGSQTPILEKEIRPQIRGVVVCAGGGESPKVQAEISAAVEALFGVPSHKIKVLKRAE